jgi:hypothetical protein
MNKGNVMLVDHHDLMAKCPAIRLWIRRVFHIVQTVGVGL